MAITDKAATTTVKVTSDAYVEKDPYLVSQGTNLTAVVTFTYPEYSVSQGTNLTAILTLSGAVPYAVSQGTNLTAVLTLTAADAAAAATDTWSGEAKVTSSWTSEAKPS